jgi:hypothetical protein
MTYCIGVERKNCKTKRQEEKKHETKIKRSPNKTHARPPRPRDPPISKCKTNARVQHHNKYKKKLWSLFRPKHNISPSRHPRRERLYQEPMGPEQRPT